MIVAREIPCTNVKKSIIIPNPMNRKVIVKPSKSGYDKKQVFTNGIFPNKIDANLLGFSRTDDGKIHPAYLLVDTTKEPLYLGEKRGYDNGIDIMDKICENLISQEGILECRSIMESDLKFFKYEDEKLDYWLATKNETRNIIYNYFYMKAIQEGMIISCYLFNSYELSGIRCYPIRPVVILDTVVTGIDEDSIDYWVEL